MKQTIKQTKNGFTQHQKKVKNVVRGLKLGRGKWSKTTKSRPFEAGFTLIELLVVIAVIGFLATASFALLNSSRVKARDAVRKRDLTQIKRALDLYFDKKNGEYPNEAACDSSRGSCGSCPCGGSDWNYDIGTYIGLSLRNNGYLQNLPKDPKNNDQYYYQYEPCCNQAPCDAEAGGGTCVGSVGNKCCKYWLRAKLETDNNYFYVNGEK